MQEIEPKDRIRVAAHDLVMKYGIRTVSMDDIAAQVGMSKKTLYQYYSDKDELIKAVVEAIIEENRCECCSHVERADDAIHEVFLAMDMMVEMFRDMNPVILYELQKYHPATFQIFQKHKSEFLYQSLMQNIKRGQAEELYRLDINPEILCKYRMEAMFIPFNPDFQRSLNKYTLLDLEEQIILNFLFGLVNLKGHRLASKYLEKKNKTENKK